MRQLIKQFYRNADEGAGSGAQVGEDGTIIEQKAEDPKPEPKYVTQDDLNSFADRIIQGLAPQRQAQQEEEFDPNEGLEEALIDPDKMVAYLAQRDQRLLQHLEQRQNSSLSVSEAVELIGDDLDKDAKAHLKGLLKDLDPATRKAAIENPQSRQMLIDSSEMASIRKNKSVPVPGSKEPGSTNKDESYDGIDGDGIRQIENAMKAFNMDKKSAVAAFRKGMQK